MRKWIFDNLQFFEGKDGVEGENRMIVTLPFFVIVSHIIIRLLVHSMTWRDYFEMRN